MRYGIVILEGRIAPRCTIAQALLVVTAAGGESIEQAVIPLEGASWSEILALLSEQRIDTLVCGGIDRGSRTLLMSHRVAVIENVACTVPCAVEAIRTGTLRPGFGFQSAGRSAVAALPAAPLLVDCLACENRVCLEGKPCDARLADALGGDLADAGHMTESCQDIALESERTLCRLSELIYFCLDMGYQRLGVAYCQELAEPTRILVGLLRRFFIVNPVWCKVGGRPVAEVGAINASGRTAQLLDLVACNPCGQAAVLNRLHTDFNVAVGLCMGADCLFTRDSRAPVTTFVVKDRSLANNPIGALYSDHYLREAALTSFREA